MPYAVATRVPGGAEVYDAKRRSGAIARTAMRETARVEGLGPLESGV